MNKNNLNDCPEYLKRFLFYMETILNRSPRTVDAYYTDLRLFLRFVYAKNHGVDPSDESIKIADVTIGEVEKIGLEDIYEYLSYTASQRSNSAAARARKASSLKRFYKYLFLKAGIISKDPTEQLEVPTQKKRLPKYLTLEDSIDLLKAVNTAYKERDYCILLLFLSCGMRLSELVGINLSDIRSNGDATTLRLLGKGNKERIVYLSASCIKAIDDYKEVRAKGLEVVKDKEALFLNKNGKRISARRVEQIVEEVLRAAGLDGRGYSPHKLRHTAATMLYQHGGVDIMVLKEMLGHVNVGTTEIYTHLSNKELQKTAEVSPFRKLKKGSE